MVGEISEDGNWMWDGNEWIPAPSEPPSSPPPSPRASVSIKDIVTANFDGHGGSAFIYKLQPGNYAIVCSIDDDGWARVAHVNGDEEFIKLIYLEKTVAPMGPLFALVKHYNNFSSPEISAPVEGISASVEEVGMGTYFLIGLLISALLASGYGLFYASDSIKSSEDYMSKYCTEDDLAWDLTGKLTEDCDKKVVRYNFGVLIQILSSICGLVTLLGFGGIYFFNKGKSW